MNTNTIADFQGTIQSIETIGKTDTIVRNLFEKASKHVAPLMKRRNWTVRLLKEFMPQNPSLLGLNENSGQIIYIRARPPYSPNETYPYEDILGTLLHELVHIEHGPHNAKFYQLLEEVTLECETLPIVETILQHKTPPIEQRRLLALRAVERRMQLEKIMSKSGQKLGGNASTMKMLSPQEAAAIAAEKRNRDDIWCNKEEYHKTHPPPLPVIQDKTISMNMETEAEMDVETAEETEAEDIYDSTPSEDNYWNCSQCTLINIPFTTTCEACNAMRIQ